MQQTTTLNEPDNKDEQTTTFNESVNQMYDKLEDKIKVVDGQLSQVKFSVSTHATSMETIKNTLDVQVKQSSDQKQKIESQMNETKNQTANRKESVKQEMRGLLDKAPSLKGLLRMISVFEQYLKGHDNSTQTVKSKVLAQKKLNSGPPPDCKSNSRSRTHRSVRN